MLLLTKLHLNYKIFRATLCLIALIFIWHNADASAEDDDWGDPIFEEVPKVECNPLTQQYDHTGTCSEMGKMHHGSDDIQKLAEQRKDLINEEVANIVYAKTRVLTDSMAKMDILFESAGHDFKLTQQSHINSCSIDKIKQRFKCRDSQRLQKVLGSKSFENFFENIAKAYSESRFESIWSEKEIRESNGRINSCISPSLHARKTWLSEDKANLSKVSISDIKKDLKTLSSNPNIDAIELSSLKVIIRYYPDFIDDFLKGSLNIDNQNESKNGLDFLNEILKNNKDSISSQLAKRCNDFEKLIEDALCNENVNPKVNNKDLSRRLFRYIPQGNSFDSGIVSMKSKLADPFSHHLVNCSSDYWECTDCFNIDDFLNNYFPEEDQYTSTMARAKDSRGTGSRMKDSHHICKMVNCNNFEEILTDDSIKCNEREDRSLATLRDTFSCKKDPKNELCSYLDIVEESIEPEKRTRRVSSFSRQILGDDRADKIAGVTRITNAAGETVVVANEDAAQRDELGIDTGLSEDDTMSLETAYDRGEKTFSTPDKQGREKAVARSSRKPASQGKTSSGNLAANGSTESARRQELAQLKDQVDTLEERVTSAPVSTREDLERMQQELLDESGSGQISDDVKAIEDMKKRLAELKRQSEQKQLDDEKQREMNQLKEQLAQAEQRANQNAAAVAGGAGGSATDPSGGVVNSIVGNGAVAANTLPSSAEEELGEADVVAGAGGSSGGRGPASAGAGLNTAGAGGKLTAASGVPLTAEGENYTYNDEVIDQQLDAPEELSELRISYLEENKIQPERPFIIYVKDQKGDRKPVKVVVSRSGTLMPVFDGGKADSLIEENLKKAPIFKDYFREIKRVNGINSVLDNLEVSLN